MIFKKLLDKQKCVQIDECGLEDISLEFDKFPLFWRDLPTELTGVRFFDGGDGRTGSLFNCIIYYRATRVDSWQDIEMTVVCEREYANWEF